MVERHLAKVEVAGSSPVIRSNLKRLHKYILIMGHRSPPITFGYGFEFCLFVCRNLSPASLGFDFSLSEDFASRKRLSTVFSSLTRNPLQFKKIAQAYLDYEASKPAKMKRKHSAPWPSGKAQVCKTFIPRFKSGWRLQENPA